MAKMLKTICNSLLHFLYDVTSSFRKKKVEITNDYPKKTTSTEIIDEEELGEICVQNMQEKIKANEALDPVNTRPKPVVPREKITYVFSTKEHQTLYKGSKFRKFIKVNQELYPFTYRALYRFAVRHEGKIPRLFQKKYYLQIIRSSK